MNSNQSMDFSKSMVSNKPMDSNNVMVSDKTTDPNKLICCGTLILAGMIHLAICVSISIFIFIGIHDSPNEKVYELFEIFIVSSFFTLSLMIVTLLRYTLSKRHKS